MPVQDFLDPYNEISYLELNKRKRADYQRDESERIENRTPKPQVKKIYVKRNGDSLEKKAKLFVWREWKSPGMRNLLSELSRFLGTDDITSIYDIDGYRIEEPEELRDKATYFVAGDESLLKPYSEDEHAYQYQTIKQQDSKQSRYTSLSAPEFTSHSRATLYEPVSYPLTPPPQPAQSHLSNNDLMKFSQYPYVRETSSTDLQYTPKIKKKKKSSESKTWHTNLIEFEKSYQLAMGNMLKQTEQSVKNQSRRNKTRREEDKYRSRSTHDEPQMTFSEFDHHERIEKDRLALAKHREKVTNRIRSNSAVIYNRRDQTHPSAYIIYVFLNGQGMECQFINFQKSQLAKGMNYVLELVARKYNVNPSKLCNMDGKKINNVSELMTRGAYVLVPAGQMFRDTWYFLPDNAIDTSSIIERIEERNEQRDRLIQKRDRTLMNTKERTQYTTQLHNPRIREVELRREYRKSHTKRH